MSIEISGHTDITGNETLNLKLSNDRAEAVAKFLASRGIDAKRLETRGYGSSQPVIANDTEEQRQNNRRVEMKILSL